MYIHKRAVWHTDMQFEFVPDPLPAADGTQSSG